jgi:hypothetical protein
LVRGVEFFCGVEVTGMVPQLLCLPARQSLVLLVDISVSPSQPAS